MSRVRILLIGLFAFWPALCEADEIRGRIAQVDAEMNAVKLDGLRARRERGTWFHLAPEVVIVWGKEPVELKELTPGRRVDVVFTERGGRKVVTRVQVLGVRPVVKAPRVEPGVVAGVLQRVAWTEREVVVVSGERGETKETACRVSAGVKVSRDGKAIEYGELKEGERATVRFEQRGKVREAVVIQAGTAAQVEERNWEPRVRRVLRLLDWGLERLEKKDLPAPAAPRAP